MKVFGKGYKLEIGVSEPADFFLEAGDGPYYGHIESVGADEMLITLETVLVYHGSTIKRCTAKPRYAGQTFADWDGKDPRIVNMLVDIKGVTHLIGGIKSAEMQG